MITAPVRFFFRISLPLVSLGSSFGAPAQEAYLKASNADALYEFGTSVDIDGDTAVVGSPKEWGASPGVNGDQTDRTMSGAGAVYVFVRRDGAWVQQAYLKASNPHADGHFGAAVAIRGNELLVGSDGTAYFFRREGETWSQEDIISGPVPNTAFSNAVDIEGDTAVIGDRSDSGGSGGVDGDESDHHAPNAGAAWIYVRHDGFWDRQAYLKAAHPDGSATNAGGVGDNFGVSVGLSGDTVVVGANKESGYLSDTDNDLPGSGAAFVFTRDSVSGVWSQQAYLKASNAGRGDNFGQSVAIGAGRIVIGAPLEGSSATGVNGNPSDDSAAGAGAAYIFERSGETWTQQAYLKASNTETGDGFGHAVALDGNLAAVSAWYEGSAATGANGNQADNTKAHSGAVYVFGKPAADWQQTAYLKASNPRAYVQFGGNFLGLSGQTLIAGSQKEWSKATGVNDLADQFDESKVYSGAAYLFGGLNVTADAGVTITSAALQDGHYLIDFIAAPGLTGWKVRGSSDLLSFPDDRTAATVIVESPAGRYRVTVDLTGMPADRYFLRLEY